MPAPSNIYQLYRLYTEMHHCLKDTASFTNINAKVPTPMPQGLVPEMLADCALKQLRKKGQETVLISEPTSPLQRARAAVLS